MYKNTLIFFISSLISILIIEIIGSTLDLKPRKWSKYNEFYSTYGWYTWSGADHLFGKHDDQTNGFKTRGKKPTKKKKIILLGDSTIETSHKLEEMPENYLEKYLPDYSVISFGSWGWGNDQQLLHLKDNIESIKPEYIVLWWISNDLRDNMINIGFGGPKPTFEVRNNKLVYPSVKMGDEYYPAKLYKFYTFRLFKKLKEVFKKEYEKIFFSKKFDPKEVLRCKKNKEYSDYSDLLKNFFDEEIYKKEKKIAENKPKPYDRNLKPLFSKDKWLIDRINNHKNSFYTSNFDFLFWNRKFLSNYEKKQILKTNLLIKEMQKVSEKNDSKFIVFFPIIDQKRFYPFKNNNPLKTCYKDIELEYSNKYVKEKLKLIFDNIENVNVFDSKFGNNYYDIFDGHLNNEANDYHMKKLSEIIQKN